MGDGMGWDDGRPTWDGTDGLGMEAVQLASRGRGGSSFAASSPCPHVQRGAIGRLYPEQSWGGGGDRLNDEALRVPRSLGTVCVPNIHAPTPARYFPHQVPYRHEPHELIVDLWGPTGFATHDGGEKDRVGRTANT